jgi:hypothetical protein
MVLAVLKPCKRAERERLILALSGGSTSIGPPFLAVALKKLDFRIEYNCDYFENA